MQESREEKIVRKQQTLNIIECELYKYGDLTSEDIVFILKVIDKLMTVY